MRWESEKKNHVNRASKSSNSKEAVTGIDRSAKTRSSLQAALSFKTCIFEIYMYGLIWKT